MARYPHSDYIFKVVMVGDHHVGKSCLARRFANDLYHEGSVSTVGAAFYSRIVELEGKVVKLQIWDTAGQEQFRAVVPLYYRLANGVVVVYDTTDERTFRNVPFWLSNSLRYAEEGVELVVLGNKCDCPHRRQVAYRQGLLLADAAGLPFFETSAKEGTNVHAAFMALLRSIKRRADAANDELQSCAVPALEVERVADNVRECC